ncbi:MAG TPA: hypothetical protein VFV34_14095 [Blastocatellia bacterium]|nr:hypothetical protein [Blastocatellia bacterium]
MCRRSSLTIVLALLFAVIPSQILAHEKVKLTGFLVDVVCATEHVKDKAEDATKFAGEHTKECALMEACVKSGYGMFVDGKWYPFDSKGNDLAKILVQKTSRDDHLKVAVEGMLHEGKIMVEKLREAE